MTAALPLPAENAAARHMALEELHALCVMKLINAAQVAVRQITSAIPLLCFVSIHNILFTVAIEQKMN